MAIIYVNPDELKSLASQIKSMADDMEQEAKATAWRIQETLWGISTSDWGIQATTLQAQITLDLFSPLANVTVVAGLRSTALALEGVAQAATMLIEYLAHPAPDPDQLQVSVTHFIKMKKDPSLKDLFHKIHGQYTKTPIGITQLADGTILVTLAGVDLHHPDQANNLQNATRSGLGWADNPYRRDVQNAIQDFVKTHPIKQGKGIIIAGHSYGGIVAQELASDGQFRNKYNITDVITYGSPDLGFQNSKVNYQRYLSMDDAVGMASPHDLMGWGGVILLSSPLLFVALNNTIPQFKSAWTGQTVYPTIGNNPWGLAPIYEDHFAYDSSTNNPLADIPLPYNLTSLNGPNGTKYYAAPN